MNAPLPFKYTYWAVPQKLLAGCCPGSMAPEGVRDQLAGLIAAGITRIINLMEVSEMELFQRYFDTYEKLLPEVLEVHRYPMRMERFPIQDRSVPTVEHMTLILQTIRTELAAGGRVYVHCHGGMGRTGTVIGCYLVEQGHPEPLQHLQELTAAEPDYFWPTPQTEKQRQFVRNWGKPPTD